MQQGYNIVLVNEGASPPPPGALGWRVNPHPFISFATMTNALGAAAKDELRDLARGSLERADVSGNASYLQTHTLYGTGASADDDAYECSCAGFLPGLEY